MSAALIQAYVSVECTGADIDRKTLVMTLGAWFDALPPEVRNIETTNKDGERVLVKVRCMTEGL